MKIFHLSTEQSFATTDLGKEMGIFETLKAKDRAEFEKKKKNKERKFKGGKTDEIEKGGGRFISRRNYIHEPSSDNSFSNLPNTFTAP